MNLLFPPLDYFRGRRWLGVGVHRLITLNQMALALLYLPDPILTAPSDSTPF